MGPPVKCPNHQARRSYRILFPPANKQHYSPPNKLAKTASSVNFASRLAIPCLYPLPKYLTTATKAPFLPKIYTTRIGLALSVSINLGQSLSTSLSFPSLLILLFHSLTASSKHKAQHERKFRCEDHSCERSKRGFPTSNDLDRHLKSVHNINNRKSKDYKCFAKGCTKPDKIWPRADNFRHHLKTMHPNEDQDDLIRM